MYTCLQLLIRFSPLYLSDCYPSFFLPFSYLLRLSLPFILFLCLSLLSSRFLSPSLSLFVTFFLCFSLEKLQ